MTWAALTSVAGAVTGFGASALNPKSLMPSSTMMSRTPGWSRASRSNRASALTPQHGASFSTRFPLMPSSATDSVRPCSASSRRARSLGQRVFAPTVDWNPSVIESPNAITVPATRDGPTITSLT